MIHKIAEAFRRLQEGDILWTEQYLSRTPFYSGFWVRHRLEHAIASKSLRARGVLFDVGCGMKPYEQLFAKHVDRYIGMEYSIKSGYRGNAADICGDGS